MSPVWTYLTKVSPVVLSGPNRDKNGKCCLRRRDGKACLLQNPRQSKALIIYSDKDYEVKGKLVLAASNVSAQAKRKHQQALDEASGSTPHMGHGPGQPVKHCGPRREQGGATLTDPTCDGRRTDPASNFEMNGRAGSGPATFQMMGRGPSRSARFLAC